MISLGEGFYWLGIMNENHYSANVISLWLFTPKIKVKPTAPKQTDYI